MLFYCHVERTWKCENGTNGMIDWFSTDVGFIRRLPSSSLLLLKSYCGQLVKYVMRCPWIRRGPQEIHGQNRSPVEGFKIAMCFSCGTDGRWKNVKDAVRDVLKCKDGELCYDAPRSLCSLLSHSFTHLDTRSTRRPAPHSCSRGAHLAMMSVGDPRGQNSTSIWDLGSSIRTFAMSQCVQIHYKSCGRPRLP